MSFFSSMRRALGFGGDDDDDIDYSIVSTDDDEAAPHDGACPAGGESARIPDSIQFEPAMQELLLDGMLAVFNESLPALSAKASTANASARHWHAASTSRWRIISRNSRHRH